MNFDLCENCRYNTNHFLCHPNCSGCGGQTNFEPKQTKEKKEMKQENNEKLTNEEASRLLKAIFGKEAKPKQKQRQEEPFDENYPSTDVEKVGYAFYALTSDLEYIGKAIKRLYRMGRLLSLEKPNEPKTKIPPIILYNEARMVLEQLLPLRTDICETVNIVKEIYDANAPDEKGKYKSETEQE